MTTSNPTVPERPTLSSLRPPSGRMRGMDRWLMPHAFTRWTDDTPERYRLAMPLFPQVLLTSSPEDCQAIFTEREGALLFGEGLRRFAPHEAMFGHDAIETLDSADHTRFRRQLTAAFHGDALKGYERTIVEVAERHVATWPLDEPVQFSRLAQDLARDVIASVIFGITDPERLARLIGALEKLDGAMNSPELVARFMAAVVMRGRWAPYPRIESAHREIAAVTLEEIASRRAHPGERRDDCLDRFLHLDPEVAEAIGDEEIVTAMRVLVIAGWATTANTLAWIAERLARHPSALARCHEDVATGESRYLTAVVQETMRMRPPVPITLRYVARDFDLRGLELPKGTLIAIDIERMHYRGDLYEQPRSFRPERFLENRPGTYTWLPFGGGVHRCIGAGFALTEARLILQTMLERLSIAPDTSRGEPSRRRNMITAPSRLATVTLRAR